MKRPTPELVTLSHAVKFPTTLDGFRKWVNASLVDDSKWEFGEPPEPLQDEAAPLVVASLRTSKWPKPYLSEEFGDLVINITPVYHFGISRLFEDWPDWTWRRQISEKNWCKPEHLDFVDALTDLALRSAERP